MVDGRRSGKGRGGANKEVGGARADRLKAKAEIDSPGWCSGWGSRQYAGRKLDDGRGHWRWGSSWVGKESLKERAIWGSGVVVRFTAGIEGPG